MTNLPIAASPQEPAASRRAQASALQQNAGLPGAVQTDENSFHDALIQMLGKGVGKALSVAGETTVASARADSRGKALAEQTDSAPDASVLPDALALPVLPAMPSGPLPATLPPVAASTAGSAPDAGALPVPQALASALIPAPAGATLDPAVEAGAAATALDPGALPLPQALASALLPVADRQTPPSTWLAGSKATAAPPTLAETALTLEASSVPAAMAPPNLLPKAAPVNALLAGRSEPIKDVLAAPLPDASSFRAEPPLPSAITVQATQAGSAAPTRSAAEPSAVVQTRVGERGWDQAVADKLVWMVEQKHQVAQLHLNPPDLGPLKIAISLDQSQATAQFFSAQASVREALEVAMPRLREMLAESGITLGNASVGAEAFREPTQQQARQPVAQLGAMAANSATVSSGERVLRPMLGLVDTFA